VTRPVKAGALALGILGLLALVAMAARSGHPTKNGGVSSHAIPNSVQDYFVTLLAIVYVVSLVAIVLGVFTNRHKWHEPKSRWLANFALVVLLMAIATGVGYFAMTHTNLRERAQKTQAQAQGNGTNRHRALGRDAVKVRQADFQWPLLAGLAGLVLLGGVLAYVRRRRAPLEADKLSLEEDIAATLETTIEDLRRERDPRRAVIAAYAQMERTLARHGLTRARSEAPFEYLARILRDLDVRDEAVRDLTQLFEYAKFSRHEVDGSMKENAIVALLAIREDLRHEDAVAA
jgi:Domain of unknown function (DUF4129)